MEKCYLFVKYYIHQIPNHEFILYYSLLYIYPDSQEYIVFSLENKKVGNNIDKATVF